MEHQLQQLQQLQQQQQQPQQSPQVNHPQHFVPIQAERVIGPSGGVMIRHAVNKLPNGLRANAMLGISIPAPIPRNSMMATGADIPHSNAATTVATSGAGAAATVATPVAGAAAATVATSGAGADTSVAATAATSSVAPSDDAKQSHPLIGMVQDVIFAMILNVPALRTKLQVILDNPSLIGAEISKAYAELQAKLTPQELEQLNSYACQDSSRRTIGSVMQTAFTNIMADGKIDMSDAPHFLTLIHDCITMFSADSASANSVPLNSNTVITFLHFVLKCILILTLDEPEETAALVMLDGSFKLVKLTVLPLIAGGKWCACACFS